MTDTKTRATGIDFVALQVRDIDRSTRFYSEELGLEPDAGHRQPGATVFKTRPVPFAVREALVDLDATDRLGWGVALWVKADDADELCSRLRASNVPIVKDPEDGPFGRFFSFQDPDGYVITVHDKS